MKKFIKYLGMIMIVVGGGLFSYNVATIFHPIYCGGSLTKNGLIESCIRYGSPLLISIGVMLIILGIFLLKKNDY